MEFILCFSFLVILAGVGIGWYVMDGIPKAQKKAMVEGFGSLGDLRGKTLAQISAVVGKPSGRASIAGSKVTYSWSTRGYYVTLEFDGDICQGVVSEIEN